MGGCDKRCDKTGRGRHTAPGLGAQETFSGGQLLRPQRGGGVSLTQQRGAGSKGQQPQAAEQREGRSGRQCTEEGRWMERPGAKDARRQRRGHAPCGLRPLHKPRECSAASLRATPHDSGTEPVFSTVVADRTQARTCGCDLTVTQGEQLDNTS